MLPAWQNSRQAQDRSPLSCSRSWTRSSWWISIQNSSTATLIVSLAVLLYGIVPHAAGNERDFSIMKWLNEPRRSRQTVATLRRLSRVRSGLNSLIDKPRYAHTLSGLSLMK